MKTENNQTAEYAQNGSTGKNPTWEKNHVTIIDAIDFLLRENERWPTTTEISDKSGLTRATVYKHLEEFGNEDHSAEDVKGLKFMSTKMMSRLCNKAMDGDAKCMRLAFEVMGMIKKGRGGVNIEPPK